jgi:hypothetical protein
MYLISAVMASFILLSICFPQSSNATPISKLTDGGSLTVKLEPSPTQIKSNEPTQMKISFLQPNTETVQPHIDYDLIVIDNSTNSPIFQASNQTGQPGFPVHTAESIVTIPFTFPSEGSYSIKIPVYGILFNPIPPESAIFDVSVQ